MAKIILDVQLNAKDTESRLQGINDQIAALSRTANKGSVSNKVNDLQKSIANLFNTIKGAKSSYGSGVFSKQEKDAERYLNRVKELTTSLEENGKLSKQEAKIYASLSQGLHKLSASFATVRAESEKLQKTNKIAIPNVDNLRAKIATLSSSIQSISKNYKKGTFTKITDELSSLSRRLSATEGMDKTSQAYVNEINAIDKSINKLSADFKETRASATNFHGSLRDIVSGFLKFQLAARVVMVPLQAIQKAWESLNETLVTTEDRILAIKRIVGTIVSDGEMASALYDIAIKYGQTFENVSEIATNFARSGLSWNDTIKATEQAVVALNVAELDATAATDGLLAVMAQFNLSTDDLSKIIDEMSKASDNYLVTTDKILKALQRTGSAASNANLSLEQTIAIITALSKATNRSGENLGTAINSLIQYSSKASALNVFSALSEDSAKVVDEYKKGAATILDVWRQVSVEIKNLKSEQADMLDAYFTTDDGSQLKEMLDGELEDFYTEVGGVYDTANTFRKNYFIALLNNMDTVDEAIGKISDSMGYTQEKNEMYLETYTSKLNTLKSTWQKVANDEQGLLKIKKDLVDFATLLLKSMQAAGGLKTVLLAVASATTMIFGPKMILGLKSFVVGLKEAAVTAGTLASTLSMAIGALGMVASIVISIVESAKTAREEAERAAAESREKAISDAVESIDKYKELANGVKDYSEEVKQLKAILEDSSRSEQEKTSAQNSLLSIQNQLVKNNESYAGSLNLVNGELSEQLDLLQEISEEQLRKTARDFLQENYAGIGDANSLLGGISSSSIKITGGSAFDETKNKQFAQKIIDEAKKQGIDIGSGSSIELPDAWTGGVGYLYNAISKATKGESEWQDWAGVNTFLNFFKKEGWEGSSTQYLTASGTIEEQIDTLQKLKVFIEDNYSDLNISYDDSLIYVKRIDEAIKQINTEEYRNAQILAEKAKAAQDYIDGLITAEEYLERVYGITKEIEKKSEKIVNNLSQIADKQKDIASALKEYRSEQEKAEKLAEKQLAIEEAKEKSLKAQQDLAAAYNERNVAVYNKETKSFELQASKKSISSAQDNLTKAEENLVKAQQALEEYVKDQAWDDVISELQTGNTTNENILKILAKWAGYSSVDDPAFKSEILGLLEEEAGFDIKTDAQRKQEEKAKDISNTVNNTIGLVDAIAKNGGLAQTFKDILSGVFGGAEDKSATETPKATSSPSSSSTSTPKTKEDLLEKRDEELHGGTTTIVETPKNTVDPEVVAKKKSTAKERRLSKLDSGGVLVGLGNIKATTRPETVNDPDLTAKILSPSSNEQFRNYVRDMNLLFGASKAYAQNPVINNVGGATTNNNGNTYVINGVSITGEQAERYTIAEIFDAMPIV